MKKDKGLIVSIMSPYWKVFRIIFVIFSLYLLGYSFYLWDGFKLYGSFSDFLLSISLASILLSITAAFTAMLIWLIWASLIALNWIFRRQGKEIKVEYLLVYAFLIVILEVLALKMKIILWPHLSAMQVKLLSVIVIVLVMLLPVLIIWLFRDKLARTIGIIQDRITPLIWLFGLFVILSVPPVVYNTWWKQTNKAESQKIMKSSITNNDRHNILLITFDALVTKNMSVYGYHRETTPFITKWAKNASIFTRTEAGSDYTSPTTASLMTGKRAWTHQLYRAHGYNVVNANTENLPLLLKNNGYYNVALIQNSLASVETFGISDYFDVTPLAIDFMEPRSLYSGVEKYIFQLFGNKFRIYNIFLSQGFIAGELIARTRLLVSKTEYPPEKIFNKFLEIIDNNPPEPFFAWFHLFPPHAPYLPPKPYIGMFDSSPKLRTVGSQIHGIYYPENRDVSRARYDEFIRYCDKTFEDFIAQLSKRNILENTVIILSADHGQSFEHNVFTHGTGHLYEQETNIPLIIKEPDQSEGRIINDLVEQIDVAPTILELANIPIPSWMEGQSLVPLMHGKELPSKPILSMHIETTPKGHRIDEGTFAVWEGNFKLIYYLKDNKSLLFNLKEDPGELKNLFDEKKEIGRHLLALIQDNLKKANERIINGE